MNWPFVNFVLLLFLLMLWFTAWGVMIRRSVSTVSLVEEIVALRLRVASLELTSPCEHCRKHHLSEDHDQSS